MFRQLLQAACGLHPTRVQRTEIHEYASDRMIGPIRDDRFSAALDGLAKHQVLFERTCHRALGKLRPLRTNRRLPNRLILRLELPGKPPALADLRRSPEQSQHPAEALRYTMAIAKRYAARGLDFHQIVEEELNDRAKSAEQTQ